MGIIQFKEANCKNCYKCIRSCPVKAIAFQDEQAKIIEEACTLCGNCLLVCPQNAKTVISDMEKVKGFLSKNEKVYVSLAPSFVSAFRLKDERTFFHALKKLGFTHVEETAAGASFVSKEYERLIKEKKMRNIITSACPSIVFLVEKYYPELVKDLAPVVSPMIAHAKMMKCMYGPRIKVVFIGPCISKKEECNDLQNQGLVDAVITFEELEKWFESENIDINACDKSESKSIKNAAARFYPVPGGILKTISIPERKNYKCVSIDGIDRCMWILDSIKKGETKNYFIEMNNCAGGCLGGPCIKNLTGGYLAARDRLIEYVKKSAKNIGTDILQDAKVSLSKVFINLSKEDKIPDEDTIREILIKTGKFTEEQELNCGACGYSTCRDKAIAVYNNKAQTYMCLPYMRERAESISNIILHSTPNAIIALNRELKIQEYNFTARNLFNFGSEDICGKYIYEVLDCSDFIEVKETERNILNRKYHYEKYDVIAEQSIIYVKEQDLIIAFIRDITREENQNRQIYKVKRETVDIAQKVIEKQMRVAQEIASLLGETTAETKVILTKLKNSILSETGEGQ